MKNDEKKAAVAAYKERKSVAGVYLVRCLASGETWVGRSPNVAAIENRLWFTLGNGSHPVRELQAAWHTHGADQFRYEIVEQLGEDVSAFARDDVLKERAAQWRATLDARSL